MGCSARSTLFCALHSDRGSHFFHHAQSGDHHRLTHLGEPCVSWDSDDSGLLAASAGRRERTFATRQNRLPQESRLARMTVLEEANRWLQERYVTANRKFARPSAEKGTAFRRRFLPVPDSFGRRVTAGGVPRLAVLAALSRRSSAEPRE